MYSFGMCRNCFREKTKEIKYDPKRCTIFQAYIYEKIKASCFKTDMIEYTKLKQILIRSHIPLSIHNYFIDEMERLKMIKKINKHKVKVFLK